MARGTERTSRRSPKDAARRTKKKPCALCRDKIEWVDYKDVGMLRKYMSDRGKIRARRVTGNCTQHQRDVALAIKTARELVLLPYTQRTTTERSGGRGRGARGERPERPGGQARARGLGDATEAEDEELATDEAETTDETETAETAEDATENLEHVGLADAGGVEEPARASVDGSEAEPAEVLARDSVAGNGAGGGDVTGNGA
jgi:small subunit ribosomal protein S18